MEWTKVLKIVDNLKTKNWCLLWKRELLKCFDSTIYSIENSKYFYFGFDQVKRNCQE